MKFRILAGAAACSLLATYATADETSTTSEVHTAPIHAETGFYTAVKAELTLGNTVEKSDVVKVEGHTGGGIGIEIGYKLGHGFAVETDGTYTRNTLTEVNCETGTCENTDADGEYMGVSLDLAYSYELTEHVAAFVKGGYEFEQETIDKLDEKGYDNGVVYAAGAEYAIGDHTALMAEYEGTTIDSPLGNSVFAGVIYYY
jgi:outer membrane protein X